MWHGTYNYFENNIVFGIITWKKKGLSWNIYKKITKRAFTALSVSNCVYIHVFYRNWLRSVFNMHYDILLIGFYKTPTEKYFFLSAMKNRFWNCHNRIKCIGSENYKKWLNSKVNYKLYLLCAKCFVEA